MFRRVAQAMYAPLRGQSVRSIGMRAGPRFKLSPPLRLATIVAECAIFVAGTAYLIKRVVLRTGQNTLEDGLRQCVEAFAEAQKDPRVNEAVPQVQIPEELSFDAQLRENGESVLLKLPLKSVSGRDCMFVYYGARDENHIVRRQYMGFECDDLKRIHLQGQPPKEVPSLIDGVALDFHFSIPRSTALEYAQKTPVASTYGFLPDVNDAETLKKMQQDADDLTHSPTTD